MSRPARAPCPTCRREIPWSEESPHRPFCSERCRLIDLGAWLDQRHAIPGEPQADTLPSTTAHDDDHR
jgi:uncharacterized protein